MSRADEFWGAHDLSKMFPGGGPVTSAPWPGMGRRKDRQDYDKTKVHAMLMHPDQHEIVHVDPRDPGLRSTQPQVTRQGVAHYMGEDYQKTGKTFADAHNSGNSHPVVYDREDGQRLMLSGHHRAAAALLQGKQFSARLVTGGWGPKRG